MAWTAPTAAFFLAVAVGLLVMTVWELRSPSVSRRGLLPLTTSRGDRLFISLLASAFVHVAWLALSDADVRIATVACALLTGVLMRWG
jgi:predicted small integral membrane protein